MTDRTPPPSPRPSNSSSATSLDNNVPNSAAEKKASEILAEAKPREHGDQTNNQPSQTIIIQRRLIKVTAKSPTKKDDEPNSTNPLPISPRSPRFSHARTTSSSPSSSLTPTLSIRGVATQSEKPPYSPRSITNSNSSVSLSSTHSHDPLQTFHARTASSSPSSSPTPTLSIQGVATQSEKPPYSPRSIRNSNSSASLSSTHSHDPLQTLRDEAVDDHKIKKVLTLHDQKKITSSKPDNLAHMLIYEFKTELTLKEQQNAVAKKTNPIQPHKLLFRENSPSSKVIDTYLKELIGPLAQELFDEITQCLAKALSQTTQCETIRDHYKGTDKIQLNAQAMQKLIDHILLLIKQKTDLIPLALIKFIRFTHTDLNTTLAQKYSPEEIQKCQQNALVNFIFLKGMYPAIITLSLNDSATQNSISSEIRRTLVILQKVANLESPGFEKPELKVFDASLAGWREQQKSIHEKITEKGALVQNNLEQARFKSLKTKPSSSSLTHRKTKSQTENPLEEKTLLSPRVKHSPSKEEENDSSEDMISSNNNKLSDKLSTQLSDEQTKKIQIQIEIYQEKHDGQNPPQNLINIWMALLLENRGKALELLKNHYSNLTNIYTSVSQNERPALNDKILQHIQKENEFPLTEIITLWATQYPAEHLASISKSLKQALSNLDPGKAKILKKNIWQYVDKNHQMPNETIVSIFKAAILQNQEALLKELGELLPDLLLYYDALSVQEKSAFLNQIIQSILTQHQMPIEASIEQIFYGIKPAPSSSEILNLKKQYEKNFTELRKSLDSSQQKSLNQRVLKHIHFYHQIPNRQTLLAWAEKLDTSLQYFNQYKKEFSELRRNLEKSKSEKLDSAVSHWIKTQQRRPNKNDIKTIQSSLNNHADLSDPIFDQVHTILEPSDAATLQNFLNTNQSQQNTEELLKDEGDDLDETVNSHNTYGELSTQTFTGNEVDSTAFPNFTNQEVPDLLDDLLAVFTTAEGISGDAPQNEQSDS